MGGALRLQAHLQHLFNLKAAVNNGSRRQNVAETGTKGSNLKMAQTLFVDVPKPLLEPIGRHNNQPRRD